MSKWETLKENLEESLRLCEAHAEHPEEGDETPYKVMGICFNAILDEMSVIEQDDLFFKLAQFRSRTRNR